MEPEAVKYYRFRALLQRGSWLKPAFVGVDEFGVVRYLSNEAPSIGIAIEAVEGYALPGFLNSHSHAFQYAMAGLAESHPAGRFDDFWTWREAMYRCALSMDPDDAEAVAAMVYAEMLRHGYTHVAEFHYLHHDKDGKPYAHLAEMGERMLSAARTSGIKITLIPVFYQRGSFGEAPLDHQRRFISKNVDAYFKLLETTREAVKKDGKALLGFSVHSLRAVELKDIVITFGRAPEDLPFHIHVSEQKKEVDDCVAYCGRRPMQWILENLPVDRRFHMVHATHLNDDELRQFAASGASVVLCPSTEGNLGDGIFRMKEFVQHHGRWSIGTDSHIGLDPLEELRMMDYRQRLITHRRNTFEGDAARHMIESAIYSGRKAMGLDYRNHFAVGQPLDAVVYDAQTPLLSETSIDNVSGTILFASDSTRPLGTLVDGKWIVQQGRHRAIKVIRNGFSLALKRLKNR